jgi:hypothetical protein
MERRSIAAWTLLVSGVVILSVTVITKLRGGALTVAPTVVGVFGLVSGVRMLRRAKRGDQPPPN